MIHSPNELGFNSSLATIHPVEITTNFAEETLRINSHSEVKLERSLIPIELANIPYTRISFLMETNPSSILEPIGLANHSSKHPQELHSIRSPLRTSPFLIF